MICLRRGRFEDYGVTFKTWRKNLNLGLFWAVVLIAGGGVLAAFKLRANHPLSPPTLSEAAIYGAGALLVLLVFLLRRGERDTPPRRFVPNDVARGAILAALFILPIALACISSVTPVTRS
ncbi:MAG: hypothetical protein ACR2OZ_12245 [Verrucomicrobiales bacterium]